MTPSIAAACECGKHRSMRGKWRYKILHETERYMVVLEPRKTYCLLITAYYLDNDRSLVFALREYEKNRR